MERASAKAKIVITCVVLLAVLAIVGLGTFAWYTLSKKAETTGISISMPNDGEAWPFEIIQQRDTDNWTTIKDVWDADGRGSSDGWQKSLTIGKVKSKSESGGIQMREPNDCYQFRPVSTSNGQDWYLPAYDGRGNVEGLIWAELDEIGNIDRNNPTPSEDGKDIPSNYVYYFDIWVRTRSKEHDYELHLNNPKNGENVDVSIYNEYNYGTFVLPGRVKDLLGQATISQAGEDLSTCMRIGFQIYNNNTDEIANETPGAFYIYEPNCDIRAKWFKSFVGEGSGSYSIQKNYKYVLNADGTGKKVQEHEDISTGNVQTILPYRVSTDPKQNPALGSFDNITMKQTHGSWKPGTESKEILDSTDILNFGKFVRYDADGNTVQDSPGKDGIDTLTLTTVPKYTDEDHLKPVHIRVFMWMEGQDVDCWNSSLAGALKIGLEFRGDAVNE